MRRFPTHPLLSFSLVIYKNIIYFETKFSTTAKFSMSTRFEPQTAHLYGTQVVRNILPRYPVMQEHVVYRVIQDSGSPIGRLLCCIGEVIDFFVSGKDPGIWPVDDEAAAAVITARQTEPLHFIITAELLHAIFGLHSRCMAYVKNGIDEASIRLAQVPDEDRGENYQLLLETFARIQM